VTELRNALQDIRFGVRLLGCAPGFAIATIATIALGIGATVAMFSVVYGIVLKPLPFGHPERLALVWTAAPSQGFPRAFVGAANAFDWRAANHVFEDLALVRTIANYNLVGDGEPERLQGARISSNLLSVLQVAPALGRSFTPQDDRIGHPANVVLLSHALWQRRFGGDPGIVGRTISLNSEPYTVVGVMGRGFQYPTREFVLWTPLTIDPDDFQTRSNYAYVVVARLKPGVTIAEAQIELNVISSRLAREYPATNAGIGAEVVPMLDDTIAVVRTPLFVLLAAVAAILFIGCANLANLLVARSLARSRDLAVRAALGASRLRLIRQSIAELVPMLAAGGALGFAAAAWILNVLVRLMPSDMPRLENVGIEWPAIVVAFVTLSMVGILVGSWPAVDAGRAGVSSILANLSRGTTPRRARIRDLLVAGQIAGTLLLLIAATLLIRSFVEIERVNPGFVPEQVLSAHLAIPRLKYPKDRDVAEFCRRILERVQALPDVESAGMVNRLPLAGGLQTLGVEFEGVGPQAAKVPMVDSRTATPDYFRTIGIPLVRGRSFTEADDERGTPVAIIDQKLATVIWPGGDPVGRRLRIAFPGMPWTTIVGVVGHIRHDSLEEDTRPQVYWNYRQRAQDRMALVVKARSDPAALSRSIAGVIRSLDAEQPLYDVRTLDEVVDRSLARRWLQTVLLATFAGLALVLAGIGVYGVISYVVGQRLREFGIRLALGARRRDIVVLVVGRGAVLLLVGASVGLVVATAAARVLASLLFQVTALDPVSFALSTVAVSVVALVACYLPARRAGRVDAALALRTE